MKNKRFIRRGTAFPLAYSILFILSGVLVFWYFPAAGRQMVWKGDGLSQHYVALCYYARWGRAVLKSILSGHPSFPTFNMHMGLGSDLFTTLQYYVIGDPFSLPAVLVPQRYMLAFHDAMILARMYLAGLCFERYCWYMGRRDLTGNLCGTLVYVFGSFALFGMRHPYFLNAMIWFPLLLWGAERIFRGERGRLFTLAVFLSCISNFYFFYMLVIMTVFYVVWRALRICLFPVFCWEKAEAGAVREEGTVGSAMKKLMGFALKFFGRALLGTGMGACFLLPILLRFVKDPRASEGTAYGLLYAPSYYRSLPEAFLSFGTDATLDNWTCMGFGAVGLISLLLLFVGADRDDLGERGFGRGKDPEKTGTGTNRFSERRFDRAKKAKRARRHTDLKLAFGGMCLLVLLPFAGAALNGFSYPANRWIWAFALLAGYITAAMLPSLFSVSLKKGAVLLAGLAAYGAVCLGLGASRSTLAEVLLAFAAVLAVILPGILGGPITGSKRRGRGRERGGAKGTRVRAGSREARRGKGTLRLLQSGVLIGAVLVTEAIHGYVEFIPGRMHSSLDEYHTPQYIEAMKASDAAGIRGLIGNEAFYRYSGRDLANNFSLLHDVSNTQYYWSLSDGGIQQFFTETGQGNGMVHLYDNLDNRTFPDEIAGVRYYIRSDGSLLPFGYEKCGDLQYDNRRLFREKEGDPLPVFSFSVYENPYALPLGFTSANYISRETWDGLSIPRRQEALMQGIVVGAEEIGESGLRELVSGEEPEKKADAETPLSQRQERDEGTGEPGSRAEREGKAPGNRNKGELVFCSEEIPFDWKADDGIEVREGEDGSVTILVSDVEASLSLVTGDTAKREVSLLVTGTGYEAPGKEAEEAGASSDAGGKPAANPASAEKTGEEAWPPSDPVTIHVKAKTEEETVSRKKIEYTLPDNPWRTGRRDFLSCCGYTEDSLSKLVLSFSRRGTYTFRQLKVIGQPMQNYPGQAADLGRHVLEEVDFHELEGSGATDRITGTISLPEKRLLCIQIPCLEGLRAFVDGEEAPLVKADTMFSALELEPGRHEIELTYTTPGLVPGAGISLASILLFLAETVFLRMKKRGSF